MSTEIVAICTGLALLTPFVKALSQWHLALRKTSKTAKNATDRQSQISAESSREHWYSRATPALWFRLAGLICTTLLSFLGIYILHGLSRSTEPLTTASAASIATGAVFVMIGFLKDWNE